ncbi:unnamed protein product, partial [Rotaria sp. Silwood2]
MLSRATHYRRKNILLNKSSIKKKISNTSDKNLSENADEALLRKDESSIRYDKSTRATIPDTTSFDITAIDTNIVEDSLIHRRSSPTSCDIAASAMIYKVRRSQNNKNIDLICKLLNALNVKNVPT